MANDGKQLEALVAAIEKILLPQGFEVKTNERVHNDGGVQIAEFDVEIRGRIGSTASPGSSNAATVLATDLRRDRGSSNSLAGEHASGLIRSPLSRQPDSRSEQSNSLDRKASN